MSARMLSIESTMTFASFGGPAGAGGGARGATDATALALPPAAADGGAAAVDEATAAAAAGCPPGAVETTVGGASFEQAAPRTAHVASPTATGAERCIGYFFAWPPSGSKFQELRTRP